MLNRMATSDAKLLHAIRWTLRVTVALQCIGNAWWFLRIEETPLLSFLWGQPDVGGLGWSEQAALGVQHALGWLLAAAAVCVLVRPVHAALVAIAVMQLALAAALVRMQGEFQLPWNWLPAVVAALFPLAEQAARVAAPAGLLALDPPSTERRRSLGIGILRAAIIVTFAAHGIEAWTHFYKFVDYNILAARNLLGWQMSQSTSETLLTVIGGVDLAAAMLVAACRWSPAVWYMVCWGFVTAASRIVVHGWELGWHEFTTRAAHFGIPLAIALYWRATSSRQRGARNEEKKGAQDE